MDLSPRLRAVCDLDVATVREYSGRHEYDGKPQDLSPDGVRAGLARLAAARDGGERLADPHDEAHLTAAEDLRRVTFAELEMHRRNPILHLVELELATYDRDYAPAAERAAAWAEHLAAWPRVVDAAIESLDQVSAPVARGPARRGPRAGGRDQRRAGSICRRRRTWGTGGTGGTEHRDFGAARTRRSARPRWPRTHAWSLTWSGSRPTATRIRRSARRRSAR